MHLPHPMATGTNVVPAWEVDLTVTCMLRRAERCDLAQLRASAAVEALRTRLGHTLGLPRLSS